MNSLGKNWFLEPAIDFELKKYVLLAWLQKANHALENNMLFPITDELYDHIFLLESYLNGKTGLEELLQKEFTGIDPETGQLIYRQNEDLILNEINEIDMIVKYSLNRLKEYCSYAQKKVDEMTRLIRLTPVGIEPLYRKEGYIFVPVSNKLIVFEYITHEFYRSQSEETYSLSTTFVNEYAWSLTSTLEGIKHDIHRTYAKFDVPAVYVCESNIELPIEQALLPIAGRKLLRMIA